MPRLVALHPPSFFASFPLADRKTLRASFTTMGFFKNRNVYLLTLVAYMGSLLFGYGAFPQGFQ